MNDLKIKNLVCFHDEICLRARLLALREWESLKARLRICREKRSQY